MTTTQETKWPLIISISSSLQQMIVLQDQKIIKTYSISTAKNGMGEEKNSYKTPRGWHYIRAKIGANAPLNAVFTRRRFTGEIYRAELNELFPERDWILTRILWLCGLEPGFNRFGNVDTMQRYIYIHGSPSERPVGFASSKGCIRMANADIVDFFDLVPVGTRVFITDKAHQHSDLLNCINS